MFLTCFLLTEGLCPTPTQDTRTWSTGVSRSEPGDLVWSVGYNKVGQW